MDRWWGKTGIVASCRAGDQLLSMSMPRSQAVAHPFPLCRPTVPILLALVGLAFADEERAVPVEVMTVLRSDEVVEEIRLTGEGMSWVIVQ